MQIEDRTQDFSKLVQVSLRDAWTHEAYSFTPWLARPENLEQLGDAINIPLTLEDIEQYIGTFKADIVARSTDTEQLVLIENQLEKTDHSHLGQLITYASGLDAFTLVWIAESFTDGHRAALDWLNKVTTQSVSFYGVEIELWRIGSSPIAPRFSIVSNPNDWTRKGFKASSTSKLTREEMTTQLEAAYIATIRSGKTPTQRGLETITGIDRRKIKVWMERKGYLSKEETDAPLTSQ